MKKNKKIYKPNIIPVAGQLIEFKGMVDTLYHNNGSLRFGTLNSPTMIVCGDNNFTFRWKISFYANGQVNYGFLYGDHPVRIGNNDFILSGNEIKGYSNIDFFENGSIMSCNLQGNHTVSIGGNSFRVYSYSDHEDYYSGDIVVFYSDIHFYPNGAIQEFKLATDASCVVGNIPITFRGGWNIYFHDNGTVAQGLSAKEVTINGKTYYDNYGERLLMFSREGQFLGCEKGC